MQSEQITWGMGGIKREEDPVYFHMTGEVVRKRNYTFQLWAWIITSYEN